MRTFLPFLLVALFVSPLTAQEPSKKSDDPIAEKLTTVKEATFKT